MENRLNCPLCGNINELGQEHIKHNEICSTDFIKISCIGCNLTLKVVKKPFIEYTKYNVHDFRNMAGLRELESSKYDSYIGDITRALIESWNKRV